MEVLHLNHQLAGRLTARIAHRGRSMTRHTLGSTTSSPGSSPWEG
ncbi:hypothetical protein DB31_0216 [Hyalangium minutum]|uniref:Uncharacterized protein n=1 Tax=Hyalangium minutum TaxID=394096 RepID=A0A085WW92_9BACT|nr:hypothetical protein DB31_0216 [Hyalangium minutum]